MWRRFFDGPLETRAILAAAAFTLVVALLAARYARRLAAAGLRAVVRDTVATSSPLVLYPLRIVGIAAFVLVASILLFPAFELAGLRPRTGLHLRTLATWTFESGLKVVLIVLIAYALVKVTALLVRRFEHEMTLATDLDALERAKRARTLGSVVQNVLTVLIVGSAALTVLREFKIDIGPILTGAGIVGLAVGFGAQTLVRDIISGFFLILENQVRVGDAAMINGVAGLVETINLRTIVLRDIEGAVHVFPNGAINTLANRSKDYSYYVVDVSVSYYQDPDQVADVVRATGEEMRADTRFGPLVLEPVEILGIDSFTEWSAVMKVRIKTVPLKQWEVGRELRRRLIKSFTSQGFPIPFPVPATAVPPVQAPDDRQ
jgi:small conductance mechanosensitive channel